jgi:hypothetical protein
MFVKQLTVFIENRTGSLEEVAEILKTNEVNIISVSLADTSEYGLLRMIVSDPENGKKVLRENGFSAMLADVIAVRLENKVGMLQKMLRAISQAGIAIEYMYVLASTEVGAMILKTSDGEAAVQALQAAHLEVLEEQKICHI